MKLRKENKPAGEEMAPPRPKKGFLKRALIIALAVVLLAGGGAFGVKALFFTSTPKVALTEKTTYGSLATTIEGTAATLPATSATLTTASTAVVEKVFVSPGDVVEAGAPLYTQDDSELDDQIESSRSQIDDSETQLTSARQQISSLQETLAGLTVSAPFSGRLLEVDARAGDSVPKGGKLALLVDDSSMKLTEYFSYAYENEVYIGMSAGVSVADLMSNLTGTVTEIKKVERITSEGTRCFAVTLTVNNPGALTEGMGGAGYLLSSPGERIYPAVEGKLEYNASKTLSAGAGGTLKSASATVYQKVNRGDILFTLDGSDYENQLTSASQKVSQLQEKIATLQKKIDETEAKRGDYTVVSPVAGKVIMVNVRAGEKPRQAGMTAVSVYNLDTMQITANIDELDIDSVSKGMAVKITQSGSERNKSYDGAITSISYEATSGSDGAAYFPVTIEIPAQGKLSAGVNVSYTISVGDAQEGVLVPVAALKKTDSGTYVFVKADKRPANAADLKSVEIPEGFYAVPVEVALTSSRYARVTSGVEKDAELFLRYQNRAPSNGSTTSQGQTQTQTQFPGQGQFPADFPGGGMNGGNWSGGSGTTRRSGSSGGMFPPG